MYCAAVSAVFADYPARIVNVATDPRTGIASQSKFLPSVAEVKEFCDAALARQERIRRYEALPKFKPMDAKPLVSEPNLFVPDTAQRYPQMLELHEANKDGRSYLGSKVCVDGEKRNGLFIPLNWWEEPASAPINALAVAAKKVFERACAEAGIDPAKGVSPALLKTLKEQSETKHAE